MPEYVNYIVGAVLSCAILYLAYRAYKKNKKKDE